MIDLLLFIGIVYLFFERKFLKNRIKKVEKTLSNEIFVELAKGNKRLYRGFWKINPNDYEKIALDPRSHQAIADDYNISRSRIGQIKHDYYKKREMEGTQIVSNYFKNQEEDRLLGFEDKHLA